MTFEEWWEGVRKHCPSEYSAGVLKQWTRSAWTVAQENARPAREKRTPKGPVFSLDDPAL